MTTVFVAVTTNCYNANLTRILHVGNSLLIKVCQRDPPRVHGSLWGVVSSWHEEHEPAAVCSRIVPPHNDADGGRGFPYKDGKKSANET